MRALASAPATTTPGKEGTISVFVVLSLAVLAATAGMVVVAGVVLRRQVKGLVSAVEDAGSRVAEVASELQEQAAVAAIEIEAMSGAARERSERRKSATARRA